MVNGNLQIIADLQLVLQICNNFVNVNGVFPASDEEVISQVIILNSN
jgi:hypothetical protein